MLSSPPSVRPERAAWALGLAAALFYVAAFAIAPPIEGDAFEYAELARNILDRGEAVHTHVRYPALHDVGLPNPAGRRLGAYTLSMLPLEGGFGPSPWVVIVPFILALLLLPRLLVAALSPVFGAFPALGAAALTLAHPTLLGLFLFDPNVEPAVMLCMFGALAAFGRGRLVLAGGLAGLAVAMKASALLLPGAFFLALLAVDRQRLRERRTWLAVALCLLVAAPYLVHLWQFSHTETGIGEMATFRHAGVDRMREGSLVTWGFGAARVSEPVTFTAADRLEMAAINTWRYLAGSLWPLGRRAGLVEMVGLAFLVLLPLGLRLRPTRGEDGLTPASSTRAEHASERDAGMDDAGRRRLHAALLALAALWTVVHAAVVLESEPRFAAPSLPVFYAAALAGLARLTSGPMARLVGGALIGLTCAPGLIVAVASLATQDGRDARRADELMALAAVVGPPAGDVRGDGQPLITLPWLSASYMTGRATVPLPMGPLGDAAWLAEERDAAGLLVMRWRGGGCLPPDPALPLGAETEHFCWYPTPDAAAGGGAPLESRLSPDTAAFDVFGHQLARVHWDPWRTTESLAFDAVARGNPWPALAWLLVIGAAIGLGGRPGRRRLHVAAVAAGVAVASLLAVGMFLAATSDRLGTIEDSAVARALVEAGLPADTSLRFEALPPEPSGLDLACGTSTRVVGSCPEPLGGATCNPDAEIVAIGCAAWGFGNGTVGPDPEHASAARAALVARLDAAEARLRAEGRDVLRLDRVVVGLPPR